MLPGRCGKSKHDLPCHGGSDAPKPAELERCQAGMSEREDGRAPGPAAQCDSIKPVRQPQSWAAMKPKAATPSVPIMKHSTTMIAASDCQAVIESRTRSGSWMLGTA